MSAGRCPGCGYEDSSCRTVRAHMRSCDAVVEMYRSDPLAVIDPEEEYRRYRDWLRANAEQQRRERAVEYKEMFEARLGRDRARWVGGEEEVGDGSVGSS